MDGSYRIVYMLYIKKYIFALSTYSFIKGKSVSKESEHIKESIDDFGAFKEELGMNGIICNKVQTNISLWKKNLETVIENNKNLCSNETKSYSWLILMGLKKLSQ